jgi:hypothetical protein
MRIAALCRRYDRTAGRLRDVSSGSLAEDPDEVTRYFEERA